MDTINIIATSAITVIVGILIAIFRARGEKIKRLETERDNLEYQVKVDKVHQETLKTGEERIDEVKDASIDKDIDELIDLFNSGVMPERKADKTTDTRTDSNKT